MEVVVCCSASPSVTVETGKCFFFLLLLFFTENRNQKLVSEYLQTLKPFHHSNLYKSLPETLNVKNEIRSLLSVMRFQFEPVLFFPVICLSVFYEKQTVPLKVIMW